MIGLGGHPAGAGRDRVVRALPLIAVVIAVDPSLEIALRGYNGERQGTLEPAFEARRGNGSITLHAAIGASVGAVIFLICLSLFVFAIAGWVVWRVFGYAGSALGSVLHPLWVRRTPKGALLHARWQAFRRYLDDFSRVEDSPRPRSPCGSSS